MRGRRTQGDDRREPMNTQRNNNQCYDYDNGRCFRGRSCKYEHNGRGSIRMLATQVSGGGNRAKGRGNTGGRHDSVGIPRGVRKQEGSYGALDAGDRKAQNGVFDERIRPYSGVESPRVEEDLTNHEVGGTPGEGGATVLEPEVATGPIAEDRDLNIPDLSTLEGPTTCLTTLKEENGDICQEEEDGNICVLTDPTIQLDRKYGETKVHRRGAVLEDVQEDMQERKMMEEKMDQEEGDRMFKDAVNDVIIFPEGGANQGVPLRSVKAGGWHVQLYCRVDSEQDSVKIILEQNARPPQMSSLNGVARNLCSCLAALQRDMRFSLRVDETTLPSINPATWKGLLSEKGLLMARMGSEDVHEEIVLDSGCQFKAVISPQMCRRAGVDWIPITQVEATAIYRYRERV